LKKSTQLQILFLSLILSSCGLIEKFKTPEQPSDATTATEASSEELIAEAAPSESEAAANQSEVDDLFSKSMEESSAAATTTAVATKTDAPSNVDSDLKALEDEFSSAGPKESQITEHSDNKTTEAPVVVQETIPEIKEESSAPAAMTGTIQNYKVQRGETLMQIAFKLYGDIGKWKDLKALNTDKLKNNSSLRANMSLKYHAPETPFVWNPVGVPYLIKNGETLGTISNNVYSTPKKWKQIYENNKPLIKNPNVIFAGFTLYYKKNPGMANYVQPAAAQPVAAKVAAKAEEVLVEKMLEDKMINGNTITEKMIDDKVLDAQIEQKIDEAQIIQAAPVRPEINEEVIDLTKNVSAPINDNNVNAPAADSRDFPPQIDAEIQNLE
jgi:nucleoid-associated protein YgaU